MIENGQNEIKFGTDGWRAIISDTFTFKNVAIVSQAISEWINRELSKKLNCNKRVAGLPRRRHVD